MTDSSDSNGSAGASVRLAAVCGIRSAGQLKQDLVSVLDAIEPVLIDASAVERIDTTTAQLLYAFVRDRTAQGGEVAWTGVNPALREAIDCLGVSLGAAYGP